MADQRIPCTPRRRCLARRNEGGKWFEAIGVEHKGFSGHRSPRWLDDACNALSEGAVVTALLPGQCASCYEVDRHVEGCAESRGLSPEEVAENIRLGVWPWLAPFVMADAPPKTDLEVDVFQVYPHGLDAMIDVSNPGRPADWRVNASDPDDDLPGQFALGWVALGPEGPTLAPWGR